MGTQLASSGHCVLHHRTIGRLPKGTSLQRAKVLQPENLFLAISIPFTFLLILLLPPVSGFDEERHAVRIEQLCNFNLISDVVGDASGIVPTSKDYLYGGEINTNYYNYIFDWFTSTHVNLDTYDLGEVASKYNRPLSEASDTTTAIFSNTAVYSPLVYFPYMAGNFIGKMLTKSCYVLYKIQLLFGVAFYIACFYAAIRIIPYAKWPLFVFALNHNIVIGSICMTADLVTLSIIALYIAQTLNIIVKLETKEPDLSDWLILLVAAVIVSGVKATYLPIAFLPLLIPLVGRSRRHLGWTVATVASCLICFFIWFVIAIKPVNTGVMWGVDAHPGEQVAFIMSHPDKFIALLINQFKQLGMGDLMQIEGSSFLVAYRGDQVGRYPLDPGYLNWALVVLSFVLSYVCDRKTTLGRSSHLMIAASCWALAFACLVLIYVALYVSFTPVGSDQVAGIQTRYYQPLSILCIVGISSVMCAICGCREQHAATPKHLPAEGKQGGSRELAIAPAPMASKLIVIQAVLVVIQLALLVRFVLLACYA